MILEMLVVFHRSPGASPGEAVFQEQTMAQVAFSAPVFVQATGSSEPALSGAIAASKQGEFSKSLVKGNGGAYLFKVLKKTDREGVKFDEKSSEQMLKQQAIQAASRFMNSFQLYN